MEKGLTYCRKCGGSGEGNDTSTSERTPSCTYCGGGGIVPVKTKYLDKKCKCGRPVATPFSEIVCSNYPHCLEDLATNSNK